jgi:hypothetical protein
MSEEEERPFLETLGFQLLDFTLLTF